MNVNGKRKEEGGKMEIASDIFIFSYSMITYGKQVKNLQKNHQLCTNYT